MRILVITNMYPPHHYGGYELSCEDAVRRFQGQGHDVSVLTSTIHVAGQTTDPDEPSRRIWRQLQPYWDDHVLLSPSLRSRLAVERDNQNALQAALGATRPDVVSVWNMGALSLGLLTTMQQQGLQLVLVLADEWPAYAPHLDAWSRLFRGRVRRPAGRVVRSLTGLPTLVPDIGAAATCLFYSESMRQAARDRSGWSLPRTGVVYSGVDAGDFPIPADDDPLPERPWAGRLLYVGRLDERKGIDTAIRALAELPSMTLRIVGRGDSSYLEELRRLVDDLRVGDRVEFDAVDRSGLRQEYGAADVLIFPSVYKEPFGIVPLEAMACDTPVIATGVGGSGEYLAHGANCLIYEPGDHAGLVAAVRRLEATPSLRATLVRAGRRTARQLTTDQFAASLLEWHQAAADGYRHGEPGDRTPPVLG